MPLSEDEQRILREMEQKLSAQDPRSARRLQETTLPRYLRRQLLWGLAGFAVGLVVLLAGFASSWEVGVVGFLLMTLSAVVVVHNGRRMGRHGLRLLAEELGERGVSDRWRERFGRH